MNSMRKISLEYLDILNSYIKIKSYDRNTGEIEYSITDEQDSLRELDLVIRTFWMCHYKEAIEQIQNKSGVLTTCLNSPEANYDEEISKLSLISDSIILEDSLCGTLLTYHTWNRKELIDFLCECIAYRLQQLNDIRGWIEEGLVTIIPNTPYFLEEFCQRIMTIVHNDMEDDKLVKIILDEAPKTREALDVDRILHQELRREEYLPFNVLTNLNIFLCTAGQTNSIPVMTSEYLWKILLSKLEYEQRTLPKDFVFCNSFCNIEFPYPVNLPPERISELRENDEIGTLRTYLRSRLGEVRATRSREEFQTMISQVNREIADEIRSHKRECDLMERTFREKMGVKASFCIASALLSGVATFGLSLPMWIGVLGGMFSGFSLKDITEDILEHRRKKTLLESNGLHLLVQTLK